MLLVLVFSFGVLCGLRLQANRQLMLGAAIIESKSSPPLPPDKGASVQILIFLIMACRADRPINSTTCTKCTILCSK